jgi:hypothetical protein
VELKEQVSARGALAATAPLLGHATAKVLGGGVGTVMVTFPTNPPRLVRLRVEVAFDPDRNPIVDGLAEKVKSNTLTAIWTLCVIAPLVAVIVTV